MGFSQTSRVIESTATQPPGPFAQYCETGWALVPIPKGKKGPTATGWNKRERCIFGPVKAAAMTENAGLAHAYSNTAALDVDDYPVANKWLAEHGINLGELLAAPDAVHINSGRENRAKLLYQLPPGQKPLVTQQPRGIGLEFRCAARNGTTHQDLLPPSIHPDTGQPYEWGGQSDWRKLPELPADVLALWRKLEEPATDQAAGAAFFNTADVQMPVEWEPVAKGGRNNTAASLAGRCFAEGRSMVETEAALLTWNDSNPEPLSAAEVKGVIRSVRNTHEANHPNQPIPVQPGQVPLVAHQEPMPLTRPTISPEAYPLEALGPVLGAAALAIAENEKIPAALCGQSVLIAAAHAAQQHYSVEFHFGVRPISLFGIAVAESGDRKSRADQLAGIPADRKQAALDREYKQEKEAYDRAQKAFKIAESQALAGGKTKGRNALEQALSGIGAPPEPPREPILRVADATQEGLFKALAIGYPSMLAGTDEGAEFFGGYSMQKETKARTVSSFCRLWDSGELDRLRGGDGGTRLKGRRVSAHWMMQPVIAEEVFSDELLQGQGFLARCLICWPDSLAGTRMIGSVDRLQNVEGFPEVQAMYAALRQLWDQEADISESGQIDTVALKFSGEATALYLAFHDDVEKALKPDGHLTTVKPIASKAAELAGRIAGVLAAIEAPLARRIEVEQMQQAIKLTGWYLAEALRLRATATIPDNIRQAQKLETWLLANGKNRFHLTEIYKSGPASIRNKAAATAAAKTLEDHGRIVDLTMKGKRAVEIDGHRRKSAWELVPAVIRGEV